jgi:hypothetical protein
MNQMNQMMMNEIFLGMALNYSLGCHILSLFPSGSQKSNSPSPYSLKFIKVILLFIK